MARRVADTRGSSPTSTCHLWQRQRAAQRLPGHGRGCHHRDRRGGMLEQLDSQSARACPRAKPRPGQRLVELAHAPSASVHGRAAWERARSRFRWMRCPELWVVCGSWTRAHSARERHWRGATAGAVAGDASLAARRPDAVPGRVTGSTLINAENSAFAVFEASVIEDGLLERRVAARRGTQRGCAGHGGG